MLDAIFWVAVGVFIGWAVPQPAWSKNLINKVKKAIEGPRKDEL